MCSLYWQTLCKLYDFFFYLKNRRVLGDGRLIKDNLHFIPMIIDKMGNILIILDQLKVYSGPSFSGGCLVSILIQATHFFSWIRLFYATLGDVLGVSTFLMLSRTTHHVYPYFGILPPQVGWDYRPTQVCFALFYHLGLVYRLCRWCLHSWNDHCQDRLCEKKFALKLTAIYMLACDRIPWNFYRPLFLEGGFWKLLGFWFGWTLQVNKNWSELLVMLYAMYIYSRHPLLAFLLLVTWTELAVL